MNPYSPPSTVVPLGQLVATSLSQEALSESRVAGGFYASVGFSQGANVAAALLAKQAARRRYGDD
jgi:predicted esterase